MLLSKLLILKYSVCRR